MTEEEKREIKIALYTELTRVGDECAYLREKLLGIRDLTKQLTQSIDRVDELQQRIKSLR